MTSFDKRISKTDRRFLTLPKPAQKHFDLGQYVHLENGDAHASVKVGKVGGGNKGFCGGWPRFCADCGFRTAANLLFIKRSAREWMVIDVSPVKILLLLEAGDDEMKMSYLHLFRSELIRAGVPGAREWRCSEAGTAKSTDMFSSS